MGRFLKLFTTMVHGHKAAEDAAETARRTFEGGGQGGALPTVEIAAAELAAGIGVLAAATLAGLTASNGEARRHVKTGALRVNDASATDERASLGQADVGADGTIKLSIGKKRHALLRPV